ncbi:hypothetical protein T08_8947 [Trichinella sp. T8]|nr:hypothetical protein T08_8947 [Trichinella sp. T8]
MSHFSTLSYEVMSLETFDYAFALCFPFINCHKSSNLSMSEMWNIYHRNLNYKRGVKSNQK